LARAEVGLLNSSTGRLRQVSCRKSFLRLINIARRHEYLFGIVQQRDHFGDNSSRVDCGLAGKIEFVQ
jgi:hypothetical protein